ncbi:DUF882 domain-containing protein [Amaricoccus sp.]|uniref:YcbK family protein n=1 Tax=Amaricoccus sp. TaxID=1872485 RepID=UPI0026368855|nr:DUF882 domain-containing protein [Amaricoccus sp.]HRO12378.1 DUF882 domain-containing protein [Amaricoccus sp.]
MNNDDYRPSRRAVLGVFAGLCAVAAAPVYAKSPGLLRRAGDVRRIRMYSQRTGESLDTIYFIDGRYVPEALEEISYFMRDWRENKMMRYDPHNVDNLAATLGLMDTDEPYLMISGYRTQKTNRMLKGAASHSYHLRAMAADVRLKSRSVKQISNAAFACNGGGVGIYNRSNFVHMDCGPVRSWRG